MNERANRQKFVTLYGWATIERETLFLRQPYLPFDKTAFASIAYSLIWIAIFVIQLFREDGPRKYVGLILWGFLMVVKLPETYDRLLKKSYSNRIPMKNIVSFTVENDSLGLETTVKLQLKNGRYRIILFRTLEENFRPFTETISQYSYQPQLAV